MYTCMYVTCIYNSLSPTPAACKLCSCQAAHKAEGDRKHLNDSSAALATASCQKGDSTQGGSMWEMYIPANIMIYIANWYRT